MTATVNYIIRTAEAAPPFVSLYASNEMDWRRKLLASVNGKAEANIPVGAILAYGGTAARPGFLICDGSLLKITDYPALYEVLGLTYGTGAGTFGLPDLRGTVPAGVVSPPAQVIVGGSVVDTIPPTADATGGTESNSVTGGRNPNVRIP